MLYSNRKKQLRALALAVCLALATAMQGCGYDLALDTPSVIGDSSATLRLTGVEQPTLFPWVVAEVSSALRNEITAGNLATWIDSGRADYNMHVKVNYFTMRSAVASRIDVTLLYNGTVSLTATIHDGSDNSEIWRNTVVYSNKFETATEEEAGRRLFLQAIRRLSANMRNTF